jgi:hypothetical protein
VAATRVIETNDNFSFDVQDEVGKRAAGPDGMPLDPPEDVALHTLVFYDRDQSGTVQERRYRFLPESWDELQRRINGGVVLASGLELPQGVDLQAAAT